METTLIYIPTTPSVKPDKEGLYFCQMIGPTRTTNILEWDGQEWNSLYAHHIKCWLRPCEVKGVPTMDEFEEYLNNCDIKALFERMQCRASAQWMRDRCLAAMAEEQRKQGEFFKWIDENELQFIDGAWIKYNIALGRDQRLAFSALREIWEKETQQ
jgi:hypothetical protein